MFKRIVAVAGSAVIIFGAASPALASRKSERTQDARIAKALRGASSASRAAKGARNTANSAARTARAARNTANSVSSAVTALQRSVSGLTSAVNGLAGQVNSYGMIAPELGVATVYAGAGPATPGATAPSLSAIGTVWSGQIPRGGTNAADATGAILYNCAGPTANPSAGCDVQLRAAIRTIRGASDVTGAVGGGFVITGITTTGSGDATGAYAGARTGNGASIANDPVAPVGFTATAPMTGDGTLLSFTPGVGHLVGIESNHTTIHLQNPGLYEIQGTLQFFDSK